MTATIDIPETKFAEPRLSGKAAITAALTGTAAHPDASLKMSLSEARALDRPIPRLVVEATARDLAGALDAHLTMAGEVDRKPLNGAAHLAKRPEGGWLADALDFTLGSANLHGNAAVDAANLVNGRLTLKAANLDHVSPLLLTKLAGDLSVHPTPEAA